GGSGGRDGGGGGAVALGLFWGGACRAGGPLGVGGAVPSALPSLRLVEEISRELVRARRESLLTLCRGRRVGLIEAALQPIELALVLLFARRLRRRGLILGARLAEQADRPGVIRPSEGGRSLALLRLRRADPVTSVEPGGHSLGRLPGRHHLGPGLLDVVARAR